MGQKVTEQVAEMPSPPGGIDQRGPARHPDWLGPDDLSLKVQEIREATDYQVPIQLKLGAARVYDDVRMAAKCRSEEHTSELQSQSNLVCRLLLEKKKKIQERSTIYCC